jgi:hypothetical protein
MVADPVSVVLWITPSWFPRVAANAQPEPQSSPTLNPIKSAYLSKAGQVATGVSGVACSFIFGLYIIQLYD